MGVLEEGDFAIVRDELDERVEKRQSLLRRKNYCIVLMIYAIHVL